MGSLDSLISSFQGVGQASKTASKGVQAAAKSTSAAQKGAQLLTRATEKYVSTLRRMEGELKSISSGLSNLVAGFKNLENALLAAFGGYALRAAGEYNKQLYDLSRTAKTMGASFGAVTKSLDDMGRSTKLSRDEAATFFATVRDGTSGIRLSTNEISDLAKTISAEFGPTLKDMTGAFRELAAVQKEDIFLFQRLNKSMSPKMMGAYVATMMAAGKMTREQAQTLTRLQVRQTLYGNEISKSEQKHRDYVDTLQEMKSTFQDLIISIGQPLLDVFKNIIPPITKVIDKVRKLIDQSSAISSLIGGAAKVGAFMAIAGTVAASLASTTGILMKIVPMISGVASQMAGGLGGIVGAAKGMVGKTGGAVTATGGAIGGSALAGLAGLAGPLLAVIAALSGLALGVGGVVAAISILGADMEGLAKKLKLPKEMARDLGKTFGGLRDELQASFQEVTDMFKAALPDLLKMLAGFGRIVADLVKSILPPFRQVLGIIIRELMPVFTKYWQSLVKLVGELIKVFVKLLVPVIKLGAVIANKVLPVASSFVDVLAGFVNVIGEAINAILGWIGLGPSEEELRAREAERQSRVEKQKQDRLKAAFETRFEESLGGGGGGGGWKQLLGTDEKVTRGQLEGMFSAVQGSFGGKEFIDALRTEEREVKEALGTIASLQKEGIDFSDKQQYALTSIQHHVAKSVATEAAIEKGLTGEKQAEYVAKQVKMIMGGQAAMSEVADDVAKALVDKDVRAKAVTAIGERKITQQVGAGGVLDKAALAAQQSGIGIISERMAYLLKLNQQMEGVISRSTSALEEQAGIALKYQFNVGMANDMYAKIQDKLRVQLKYQQGLRDTVMEQTEVIIEQGKKQLESAKTAEERAKAERVIQEGLATQEEFMAKIVSTQSKIIDQNIKRIQSGEKTIELIDSEVGVLESQLGLVDSLYGGLGPRIGLQAQMLKKYQEQEKTLGDLAEAAQRMADEYPKQLIYQKMANEYDEARVKKLRQQVDLSKGLRDQYVDAIHALRQVEGSFQKFVITRETGFGKALSEFGLKGGFATGGIGAGMKNPIYEFAEGGGVSVQHPFQAIQFWQQAFEEADYAPGGVLPWFGGTMKQTPGGAETLQGVGLGQQGPMVSASLPSTPNIMGALPLAAISSSRRTTAPDSSEQARKQVEQQAKIREAGGEEAMWLEKIYELLKQGIPVAGFVGSDKDKPSKDNGINAYGMSKKQEEGKKKVEKGALPPRGESLTENAKKDKEDNKAYIQEIREKVTEDMRAFNTLDKMDRQVLPTGAGDGADKDRREAIEADAAPVNSAVEAALAAVIAAAPDELWEARKAAMEAALAAGTGGGNGDRGEKAGLKRTEYGVSLQREGAYAFRPTPSLGIPGMTGAMGRYGMASGGSVPGSGSGDTVPAWLAPGEFVMRRDAVSAYGMNFMNALNAKKFQAGGAVESRGGNSAMYSVNFNIKADNAGDILSKVNIKLSEVLNDTFGGNTAPHRFEQSQDLI